MILLTYHAKSIKPAIKPDDIAGAHINCWINTKSYHEAEKKASKLIVESGWKELQLEEVLNISRSDYSDNDEKLQYFEQALVDNEVLLVFTYPLADQA